MAGYIMYRLDRKKGGGWLLAYFQQNILSKEIKIPKTYKTLESIAVEAQVCRKDILFLGIYRPPKQSKTNCCRRQHTILDNWFWSYDSCQFPWPSYNDAAWFKI
jgi:hypothetical protein